MRSGLAAALKALQRQLAAQRFAVPGPEQADRRAARDRVAAELGGHMARLKDFAAPLLTVIGGGTGAGKSTVTNTLVGRPVAATGVIRPTTSSPTLLVDPTDIEWFTSDRVLPDLARVHLAGGAAGGQAGGQVLHVVQSHAIPPGIAIIDAPDIDSVATANRDLADALLDAADVWVWLATARTYADAEGMGYLRRAARRRTALAVVLTQVREGDAAEVIADLSDKLAAEGLAGTEVFVVPMARVEAQCLPLRAVADLRTWLYSLAAPPERERLRRQTLEGALDDLVHEVEPLALAIEEEASDVARLAQAADRSWARAPDAFGASLEEGLPLRQEVLARWGDFVGTTRFAAMFETASGMLRGWLRDTLSTVASAEEQRLQRQVQTEVAGSMTELFVAAADLAAAETAADWERTAAGWHLVEADPALRRADDALRTRVEQEVAAWQGAVTELIRTKGAARKVRARWATTLVNAAATAAILLAFASTGGLTGVEVVVAGGAGAANQALLTRLLGAQNLQWLLREVREDLLHRMRGVAEVEARRYGAALEEISPGEDDATALRAALGAVAAARTGP